MAEVLIRAARPRAVVWPWWPVDRLLLTYLALTAGLKILGWNRLPQAAWLLAADFLAVALLGLAVRFPHSRAAHVFRHWYPLPYVIACYKEMSLIIPAVRGTGADAALAALEQALWGVQPTVWLERWLNPLAVEVLQTVYFGFVPMVLSVCVLLWRRRRFEDFRYYGFAVALGFVASYVGYLAVPVRGPRFFIARLYTREVHGWILHQPLSRLLDQIESYHFDCFPSGHTALMIVACWGARMVSRNWFRVMVLYTLGVVSATVYLRYHYTVDLLAGAVLAGLLLVATPHLYRRLGGRTVGGAG